MVCWPDFFSSLITLKDNHMNQHQPLRGMATVSFWADDVKAAKTWYSKLLGINPYFERPDSNNPAYIEFRFGDFQHALGIIDKNLLQEKRWPGPAGRCSSGMLTMSKPPSRRYCRWERRNMRALHREKPDS